MTSVGWSDLSANRRDVLITVALLDAGENGAPDGAEIIEYFQDVYVDDCHRTTVWKHLTALVEDGLVERTQIGSSKYHHVTDAGSRLLEERAIRMQILVEETRADREQDGDKNGVGVRG